MKLQISTRSVWITTVIATAVAVIGFVSLHNYAPQVGILANAIDGRIYLRSECTDADYERLGLLEAHHALDHVAPSAPRSVRQQASEAEAQAYDACNVILPYRWVLIGCVIAIAAALLMRRRD